MVALKQLKQDDSKFQSSLAYTVELHNVLYCWTKPPPPNSKQVQYH